MQRSQQVSSKISSSNPVQPQQGPFDLDPQEEQPLRPSGPYPLPPAPKGYKFRAIITPRYECILSPSLIAGRYYPRICHHPILKPIIEEKLRELSKDHKALALEGLVPGYENSVDPTLHQKSRMSMFNIAEREAKAALADRWGSEDLLAGSDGD